MLKLKLALRYLVRKPITLFAVVSVLLGTTAFVVVLGVMDGYVTVFNERSRAILSDMVIVLPGGYLEHPDLLIDAVKKDVPDVVECSAVTTGMAVIKIRSTDGKFTLNWCHFLGVDAPLEHAVTGIDVLSRVPPDADDWIIPGGDLLGTTTPDNVSQIVLVTSGRRGGGEPVKVSARLVSVVNFGLHQYDKEFAYVSRRQAAVLAGLEEDWATEIRVRIRSPRRAEAVSTRIQAVLDRLTDTPGYFRVFRYQETSTMFRALKLQRALAQLVLGCLFAAAGFAVVAICYMIVLQKTRDIGVLRTIGLSRGGVRTSFVIYGVCTGLTGVVLGMLLGVFVLDHMDGVRHTLTGLLGHDPFPVSLYGLKEVPTEVDPWALLVVAGVALAVSFLGSLYPAHRAARLNVVESLRYE